MWPSPSRAIGSSSSPPRKRSSRASRKRSPGGELLTYCLGANSGGGPAFPPGGPYPGGAPSTGWGATPVLSARSAPPPQPASITANKVATSNAVLGSCVSMPSTTPAVTATVCPPLASAPLLHSCTFMRRSRGGPDQVTNQPQGGPLHWLSMRPTSFAVKPLDRHSARYHLPYPPA